MSKQLPSSGFKSPAFDDKVRDRFHDLFHFAQQGFCDDWEMSADGALALTLVFDQFPVFSSWNGGSLCLMPCSPDCRRCHWAPGFDLNYLYRSNAGFRTCRLNIANKPSGLHCKRKLFATIGIDPLGYDIALRRQRNSLHVLARFPHRNKALGRP